MIPISQIRAVKPWEGKGCAQDPLEGRQLHEAQHLSPQTLDSEPHLWQRLHLCIYVGAWGSGLMGRCHRAGQFSGSAIRSGLGVPLL